MSIFADDSVIFTKRVHSIQMTFNNSTNSNRIDIDVTHTAHISVNWVNRLKVTGNDSLWVNGTLAQLSDVIDGIEPQYLAFKKYEWILGIVMAIGMGIIVQFLIEGVVSMFKLFIPSSFSPPPQWAIDFRNSWNTIPILIVVPLVYFWYWFLGTCWLYTLRLMPDFSSLWPSVELLVGPAHTFKEKKKREMWGRILLIGVLPFTINILSGILLR